MIDAATEIANIRGRLQDAENAHDADAIGALLTDDAVLMVPDCPVQEGKDACVSFLREIFSWQRDQFERHATYTSAEISVLSDLAYDRGVFAFTITPRTGGETQRVTGKYFWLLRRADDRHWKLARLIASRDDPDESVAADC